MSEPTSPFELVFGGTGVAAEHFPRIRAAALAQGSSPPDRDGFLALPTVSELLAEIAPASGEGAVQIGLLAFHAYRRWDQGGDDFRIAAAELPTLLARPALGAWQLQPPRPAGYVALPGHQLWVPGGEGQPAEPVDGFFWVTGTRPETPLDVLLVLGTHAQRAGLTVIELSAGPLPAEGHWGDQQMRVQGEDFRSELPGGEHLFTLGTGGEVLKLVSRVFWRLAGHG
jgi:hypothetical protein